MRKRSNLLLGEDVTASRSRRVLQKAYRCAVRFGNHAAAELLRRRRADESEVTPVDLVLGACVAGDRAALPDLLRSYSPSLLRNKDHGILSWAIRTGRHPAVPLLLEAGVDPNVPDNDGETPLHLAVRSGVLDTLDALLRAGAVADQPNFDSQTPLEIASALTAGDARERITRRLLDAGASPARMRPFLAGSELENANLLFESAADAVAAGDWTGCASCWMKFRNWWRPVLRDPIVRLCFITAAQTVSRGSGSAHPPMLPPSCSCCWTVARM